MSRRALISPSRHDSRRERRPSCTPIGATHSENTGSGSHRDGKPARVCEMTAGQSPAATRIRTSEDRASLEGLTFGAQIDSRLARLGPGNDTRRLMRVADHAPQPPAAKPPRSDIAGPARRRPAQGGGGCRSRPHAPALWSGLAHQQQLLVSGRSGSAVSLPPRRQSSYVLQHVRFYALRLLMCSQQLGGSRFPCSAQNHGSSYRAHNRHLRHATPVRSDS